MNNNKTIYELMHNDDFDIYFNEYKFKPCKNIDRYWSLVQKGYKIMKQTDIVIGGLFMNSSNIFDKFYKRIESMSQLFRSLKIVIFENDSIDNSRIKLLNWEKNNKNVFIIKCDENEFCLLKSDNAIQTGEYSSNRMKKMSKYRNILLNYIKKNFSNTKYVGFIDTDLKGPISFDGLAHNFGIEDEIKWDMISAYGLSGSILTGGKLLYYDPLAVKTDEYQSSNLNSYNYGDVLKIYYKYILGKNRGDEPIKIKSAFCGFAIYKMDSLKNADYTPLDGIYICEHVILHNNMILNGHDRIYINPNLLLFSGKQGDNNNIFYY